MHPSIPDAPPLEAPVLPGPMPMPMQMSMPSLPSINNPVPPPLSVLLDNEHDYIMTGNLSVSMQSHAPVSAAGVPAQMDLGHGGQYTSTKEKGRKSNRPLPETKKCNLCYQTWPVTDFYRSSSGPVPYCKHGCHNLFQRANKCGYRIRELREAISNGTLDDMLKMDKLPAGAGRARARAEFRAERGLPDGFAPVQPGEQGLWGSRLTSDTHIFRTKILISRLNQKNYG